MAFGFALVCKSGVIPLMEQVWPAAGISLSSSSRTLPSVAALQSPSLPEKSVHNAIYAEVLFVSWMFQHLQLTRGQLCFHAVAQRQLLIYVSVTGLKEVPQHSLACPFPLSHLLVNVTMV